MKCRDCKWCYTNETMSDLYICVNGNGEMLGQFTGLMCEDECKDGEAESEVENEEVNRKS